MTSSHQETGPTSPELARTIGLFPLTNIVVANMIGAGIFTTSGLLMEGLRNPLLMLGLWVIGGVLALCGALAYGEVGSAIPRAGGEYAFLSELFHPLSGFLSGWVSFFVGFSAPIAASAIGFAEYFVRAFPQILGSGGESHWQAIVIKKALAVLVIVGFTAIHFRGLELGCRVQNILTILKVVLIVGLILAGFASAKGSFGHLITGESYTFDFKGWKVAGLSLMWIMFAYSGWNASAYIGSEVKNPAKNLPRSLLLGTGVVVLLYLGLNLLYVYALEPEKMYGVIAIGGAAAGSLFGKGFAAAISLLISFALFSSLSAFIILGPRVYYSMAKDGCFFRMASEVHPVFRSPSKSILLQAAISIVIVLSGSLDQILTYMGFSLGIFPILVVVGVFKLRARGRSPFRMPGFPIVPIIYLVPAVLILVLSYFERPVESSIAVLTVVAGIPAYYLFRSNKKNRGRI